MESTITKTQVPDSQRLGFLPRKVGKKFLRFEMNAYDWMGQLCPDYLGGYWQFYALSNGGFYMALDSADTMRAVYPPNDFDDQMSTEALSITANLFALNGLCWLSERVTDAYYALRDFAAEHEEDGKIMRLID